MAKAKRSAPPKAKKQPTATTPAPSHFSGVATEIILLVIDQIEERPLLPLLFPDGPSSDLLNLRATSTQFHRLCHPLIWRSLSFVGSGPLEASDDGAESTSAASGPDPDPNTSLANWVQLVQQSDALIAASPREVPLDRIEVEMLQLVMVGQSGSEADDLKELEAVNLVLDRFASSLKVVFLKSIVTGLNKGNAALKTLNEMPLLRTLRLNDCELGSLRTIKSLSPFPALRSLQIMHGSERNFQLVKLAPNLTSLLLWPSSRRLGSLADDVLAMVPRLDMLSLDVVEEPEFITILAQRYIELGRIAQQKSEGPLPLTELFLKGHLPQATCTTLLASFKFVKLERLALYHTQTISSTLIDEIAVACPSLKGLALVRGAGEALVDWDEPLKTYTTQLAKFSSLTFFGFDRRNNDRSFEMTSSLEPIPPFITDLNRIKSAAVSLLEIAIIESDDGEDATGFIATWVKGRGGVEKLDRVDYLIPFARWADY